MLEEQVEFAHEFLFLLYVAMGTESRGIWYSGCNKNHRSVLELRVAGRVPHWNISTSVAKCFVVVAVNRNKALHMSWNVSWLSGSVHIVVFLGAAMICG